MTVGELIERLKSLPEASPVAIGVGGVKLWAEKVTITIGKVSVILIESESEEE